MKDTFIVLCVVCVLSACSHRSLLDDTYRYTQQGTDKEMRTAFIILSNLALNDALVDTMIKDHQKERDSTKQFMYEYLLAKRLQEERYILSFIKNARVNLPILMDDDSYWVSITSPILTLLAVYSATNDDALAVLLLLSTEADGVVLSAIASSLFNIYQHQPERLIAKVNSMKLDLSTILLLMEDM